jgi:hypothetical protein
VVVCVSELRSFLYLGLALVVPSVYTYVAILCLVWPASRYYFVYHSYLHYNHSYSSLPLVVQPTDSFAKLTHQLRNRPPHLRTVIIIFDQPTLPVCSDSETPTVKEISGRT